MAKPRTGGRYAAATARRRRQVAGQEARVRLAETELDERRLEEAVADGRIGREEVPAWREAFGADRTAVRALLDGRPTRKSERALSEAEYQAGARARLKLGQGEVV